MAPTASLGLKTPCVGNDGPPKLIELASIVAFAGLGLGLAGPAANNAAIELAPDRIAAVTGMRGMFRSLGGAIGVALIVLITSTASSVQHGLAIAFVGLSVLTVLTSLLVLGIPDKSTPLSLGASAPNPTRAWQQDRHPQPVRAPSSTSTARETA